MKVNHLPTLKDLLKVLWIGSDICIVDVTKETLKQEIYNGTVEDCYEWLSDEDDYSSEYYRHVVYMCSNKYGRIIIHIY